MAERKATRIRNHEMSARDLAPIAVEVEECMQLFHRLCAILEANQSTWKHYYRLLSQSYNDLVVWAEDTGATSHSLDRSLRRNSTLQQHTRLLLEELSSELLKILEAVQTAIQPLVSPFAPPMKLDLGQGYFDVVIGPRNTFPSINTIMRPRDSLEIKDGAESADSIDEMLETVSDNMECLQRLVTSLKDPYPPDTKIVETSHKSDLEDVEMVRRMFPRAALKLVERLGQANWKRRQYLAKAHAQGHVGKIHRRQTSDSIQGSSERSVIESQSAIRGEQVMPKRFAPLPTYRTVLRRRASASGSETASNTGTVSSRPETFTSFGGTSVADESEYAKPNILTIPNPPVKFKDGKAFQCPYCSQTIPILKTESEWNERWNEHVLADLEPYLCTFNKPCIRADKTYGSRHDWLCHELDNHRTGTVWFCSSCTREFLNEQAFKEHVSKIHERHLESEQLSVMANLCKRSSEKPWEETYCPLCNILCSDAEFFSSHVGHHLEQISLTCLQSNLPRTGESLPTSPLYSRSSSDYGLHVNDIWSFVSGLPQLNDSQNEITKYLAPAKVKTHGAPKRPSLAQRGPSYSYLIEAREFKDATELHDSSGLPSPSANPDESSPSTVEKRQTIRTVLPARNKDFVGRIDEMARVHHELSKRGHICSLSGVGGLGKSAIAGEYTYRFESAFAYIFWIQAETPMICAETYSRIALKCVPNTNTEQDQDRLVAIGREFLEQTTDRWLVVFDNVDQNLDLRRFLPSNMPATSGSVLITTNGFNLGNLPSEWKHTQIDLRVLSLEESRRLLLCSTSPQLLQSDLKGHPEYELAGDVAKLAQKLPLALSLIAGYILVSECTLSEFVELWNERSRNTSGTPVSQENTPTDTEKAMDMVWNIGLREVTTDARELLNILAFLDSDTIQKSLLVGPHTDSLLEMLHSSEVVRFRKMTRELTKRRLINVDLQDGEEVFSIHRKLQRKMLQDLNRNEAQRQRVFTQAFLLVRTRFPKASPIQVPEPVAWPVCRKYLPHVLSLRKLFSGDLLAIAPSVKLAQLFSDGGIDLWERGLTQDGLDLLRTAEGILDVLKCEEHLLRANIHVIISLLIQDSGLTHLGESMDRITGALDIREEHRRRTPAADYTRNDEILLYNAISDYGCVLLQYNRYQEAEPLFKGCLKQYQSWDEPEKIPYEYAKYYHHAAFCRMYEGDFVNAIDWAKQGLHWVQEATGQSAATNRWKFDLACLTLQSGDLEGALNLHKEVLDARVELHGKYGFLTMQSCYAVGAMQDCMGDSAAAEQSMRTVLDMASSQKASYPEAAVARTQFHLSLILKKLGGKLDEADKLAALARDTLQNERSLERLKEVPEEHELALFDHLQPVFDGRFTGVWLLRYLRRMGRTDPPKDGTFRA